MAWGDGLMARRGIRRAASSRFRRPFGPEPPKRLLLADGPARGVSQLTQHGLIDEYQLAVCLIFLGNGRRLLTGVSKNVRLDLLEAKALPSGDVMFRYARRN